MIEEKKIQQAKYTVLCGPFLSCTKTILSPKIPSEIKNNLHLSTSQTNLTFSF